MRNALFEAVKDCLRVLAHIGDAEKTSKICLEAVSRSELLARFVPVEMQTEALALIAVKENGLALKYISKIFIR